MRFADKTYTVTRYRLSMSITRASCTAGLGTATVTEFDNHIVGCHVHGGSDCNSSEVSFADTDRPIYVDANGNAYIRAARR
jgi:hypothetical protein